MTAEYSIAGRINPSIYGSLRLPPHFHAPYYYG